MSPAGGARGAQRQSLVTVPHTRTAGTQPALPKHLLPKLGLGTERPCWFFTARSALRDSPASGRVCHLFGGFWNPSERS